MKINYYIFLFLLLFFLGCTKKESISNAEVSSEDSLVSYLSSANNADLPIQKREAYNQKAFDIAIDQPSDSMNHVYLFRVANRYFNMNNWKKYNETVQAVLKKAIESKDTVNMARGYTYLGDYYGSQSVSDSAFKYYTKAEKTYEKPKDIRNLAKTRLNKALLQFYESDFSGSEISVYNALREVKDGKSKDIEYDSYNLLGIVSNEREEYDRALEFHNKALKTLENIDESLMPAVFQSKASSLNNIGFVYLNRNMNNEAKSFFIQGLQQENLKRDKPFVYAMLLDNLAYSKFKLNEKEGVLELFYQSLRLRDSLKLTPGIIQNKLHLSDYFVSKNDTIKAIQYSKEALATSRSSKNLKNVLASLKQLIILEPQKATAYNKEYIAINDSLQKAERNMGEKFSRIEYETDEIKTQNTDLEYQNRKLLYIFGAVTILGLFLYIIKAQKAKTRELLYKQEQQKANEEIYNLMISQQTSVEVIRIKEKKRVAQELHDGVLGRMFGVRMNLDGLNKSNDLDAAIRRNDYLAELKNIEQDIREISHDLNREKSELINNFVAIVDNLFEEQQKTFKSKLVSTIDSTIKWELVGNSIKINLFRIIQESLQNINKYANADYIRVEFKKEGDNLLLLISDNGIGFDVNRAKKGIGLQNILSRTKECNGIFNIESKKGEGTKIKVTTPMVQKTIPA